MGFMNLKMEQPDWSIQIATHIIHILYLYNNTLVCQNDISMHNLWCIQETCGEKKRIETE